MKKSLISAIKKLLAKLGAEEIEGNNLVEVIDSGADAIEGGGGSGDQPYIITLRDENKTIIADKNIEEILSAFASGKRILARFESEYYSFSYASTGYISFLGYDPGSGFRGFLYNGQMWREIDV